MKKMTDVRLVLLNENDNIFVCCDQIDAGETLQLEGEPVEFNTSINIGHKVARTPIANQEKVYKYGVSIGSATADINRGDHVHLHNLKSDYIPSHTRNGVTSELANGGEEL
jgi:hypothetical protein